MPVRKRIHHQEQRAIIRLRRKTLLSLRSTSLTILLLLLTFFSSLTVHAETYGEAYNKYVQGDFVGAEASFKASLENSGSNFEKARTYKMLGISQYMLGKRQEAEDSFKDAKKLQKEIQIEPSEVLDESVLEFFKAVEAPHEAPAPKSPTVRESVPAAVDPIPAQKKARLLISSNVQDAKVVIDSQLLWSLWQELELEPGIHEVEVSAPEYSTLKRPVNLEQGKLAKVQFNLKKRGSAEDKVPTPPPPPSSTPEVPVSEIKPEEAKVEPPAKAVRKKGKKRKTAQTSPYPINSGKPNPLLSFLPFGAGQFSQGKTLLGAGFLVGQIAGLGLFYTRYTEADSMTESANKVLAQRQSTLESLPEDQQQGYFDETTSYYASQNVKISTARTNGYYGLGLFLGLWIASSLEALYNDDSSGPHIAREPSIEMRGKDLYWKTVRYETPANSRFIPQVEWSLSPFIDTQNIDSRGIALGAAAKF
ncbi:MAG: PEGA domain-containing protein [Oligoflexales bacterium]|nr:PEGA domain-containing protein [Oligoflexales bacterium]